MHVLTKRQIGKGWKELGLNVQINYLDQFLDYESGEWRPSPILKKDKAIHLGRMNYRRPVTRWNKLIAFLKVMPSLYERLKWERHAKKFKD